MIINGMIVTSLDKKIKGQVVNSDYDTDYAKVYNWLHDDPDQMFVETNLSNLEETCLLYTSPSPRDRG